MKSKVISVLILSTTLILVSFILVSCMYDGSPTQNTSDLETLRLSKRKIHSENITFEGDLEGSQEVVDCCPNAGPNPEYTMTLSESFPLEFQGTHTGYIFMNSMGGRLPWAYKVVFWWTETEGDTDTEYSIEFRGGVVHKDKKTKILIVTFVEVHLFEIWIDYEPITDTHLYSFTLTRDPHHPATK